MDNFVIGVVTSKNLEERYKACKNTWAKDFDNIYFFGGYMEDENLVKIPEAGEDYNSHFLKQQLGLKFLYEKHPNMDWYNMASCDNVLYKKVIVEELKKYDSNQDIFLGENCGTWTDQPMMRECGDLENIQSIKFKASAGGASFWISNKLMSKIYKYFDEFNSYWTNFSGSNYPFSDVAISYMIKKYTDVDIINNSRMFSQNITFYENILNNPNDPNRIWYSQDYLMSLSDNINNPMSFHYVKPNEMEKLYKRFK